ncbi:MAG: DUF4350 domain-containing protein [Pyrinomonadaceae bacterium]|nr:DUF4350 domain-containing protein [Pyrinomonadaceae bacterium]
MRQKFFIFLSIIILIIVLIGLNAASYVKQEKTPDNEFNPNRSTYNTGATGTRAFYDLLAETGRTVTRWQESPSALSIDDENKPDTFVVIGKTRREFTDTEIESLLRWVSLGGKLVLIDREPPSELVKSTANWKIAVKSEIEPPLFADPSDIKQMTEKTVAAKPAQPTVYTSKVNAVQASRFASSINFERFANSEKDEPPTNFTTTPSNSTANEGDENSDKKDAPISTDEALNRLKGKKLQSIETKSAQNDSTAPPTAPVAHLADNGKTLLVDFPFGAGRIVFLSDPYIVSNGGINLVDNAQLAINIVASGGGIIAFDEFHQGFGAGQNRLLDYFAGTPLTAIFLQFAVLVGVILFTNSRRFARPLPENEPNRLSKLEYVAAMAELQRRTKAFDLAMENIYKDFRRRVSRLVGADNLTISHENLARLIAERANLNAAEIETLLSKCEAVAQGEPTNKRETLNLISRLRQVEETLGLKRNRRAKL